MDGLTPKEIVAELDKYIIGQYKAKKMVSIALRNRTRRCQLSKELKDEVAPKNIIMIGPTGVGKTEIARRLAKLSGAPFIKVEASKYTEVGYVGRDVESMVRDLTETAVSLERSKKQKEVREKASQRVEERILDILLPKPPSMKRPKPFSSRDNNPVENELETEAEIQKKIEEIESAEERWQRNREKFAQKLRDNKLEDTEIELDIKRSSSPMIEIISSGGGMEEMGMDIKSMMDRMMPSKPKRSKMPISEARQVLMDEELDKLLDMDKIIRSALNLVEEQGIIFIDEIDKIAGRGGGSNGPDVSREGVQRDILPIVEGSTVYTKYGMVNTDHILFIAAGAFHQSKPSDLIPELQGRFPLRVELSNLGAEEFVRILTEPQNALTKQYVALLETEGVELLFTDDAIEEIARCAYKVNSQTENIGARRLHTIMEKILENLSFEAPDLKKKNIKIDAAYVKKELGDIIKDEDLSRFIL